MDDSISRQAAINVVEEYLERYIKYIGTPEDNEMYAYARGLLLTIAASIERLSEPPTEVEPVKYGRWEPVTHGRGGHECSICNNYAPSYKDGTELLSRYCPYCGAKMVPISASPENG